MFSNLIDTVLFGLMLGISATASIISMKKTIEIHADLNYKMDLMENKIGNLHFFLNKNIKENECEIIKAFKAESQNTKKEISEVKAECVSVIRKELILPPRDKQYIVVPVTEDGKLISTNNVDWGELDW